MLDPSFAAFAARVMEEAAVTLQMPEGTDLAAYRASLLTRFANPALHHRTWQIAMDGSQKLPQRLLSTMHDRLQQGLPIETHALAVAGWMRYVTACDEHCKDIDVRDPIAAKLADIAQEAGPVAERLAPALLAVGSVFGTLGADSRMANAVTGALARLYQHGARRTLAPYAPPI